MRPGYDAEGAFSPDGKLIVFCSLRDAFPLGKLSAEDRKRYETDPAHFGEIYLMNADGSDQRRLTPAPGYDGGPFFSPDGQRIVWRRFDESGMNADIYTMKTDGSDVRRVTDFKSMSWAPYFHPSGEYLIFTSNKLGFSNFELFLVDAEGNREPVRVTFTDGFDGLPVFSPDGASCAGRPAARPTANRNCSSPIGTMTRLATNFSAPMRHAVTANPMKPIRRAFSAWLTLLTSLAPLCGREPAARPPHLPPRTCAARRFFGFRRAGRSPDG